MNLEKKKLNEIAEIIMGQSPPGTSYNENKDGVPLINGPTEFNKRYPQKIQWTTEPTKICNEGDILICVRGSSTGRINIANDDYCIGRGVAAIRGTEDTSTTYLEYLLDLEVDKILKLSSGSTFPNITSTALKNITLLYHSKREQENIVEILSIWDEAIAKTEKLIQAKKRYKKGLMQRLLSGKVRFPEFEGEDWVEVKLNKFFKPFSDKNKDNEDLPILSCSKVHGITLQSNIFDKRVASKDIKRYKVVERDDLIYDPMLLWDASIGFLKEVNRGVISPAYNTFKFKENSGYRPFFEYLFDTHYMRYNYKAISQGTNRRRRKAPAEAFLKIDIRLPKSVEEQKKIATVLGTLSKEIEVLKKEVTLYQKQKKGLMQQLLTGKVRVKHMETGSN